MESICKKLPFSFSARGWLSEQMILVNSPLCSSVFNESEGNTPCVAIAAIILHYTGHLKRWNCEWILIVLAIAVFPAVLFL